MIVLSFPQHITIAVKFDKPIGNPIVYKGNDYWVCEPTPQKEDLRIGDLLPNLRKVPYDVVYSYYPSSLRKSKCFCQPFYPLKILYHFMKHLVYLIFHLSPQILFSYLSQLKLIPFFVVLLRQY